MCWLSTLRGPKNFASAQDVVPVLTRCAYRSFMLMATSTFKQTRLTSYIEQWRRSRVKNEIGESNEPNNKR